PPRDTTSEVQAFLGGGLLLVCSLPTLPSPNAIQAGLETLCAGSAVALWRRKPYEGTASNRRFVWEPTESLPELFARIGFSRRKSVCRNFYTRVSPAAGAADKKSRMFCTVHGLATPCTSSSPMCRSVLGLRGWCSTSWN